MKVRGMRLLREAEKCWLCSKSKNQHRDDQDPLSEGTPFGVPATRLGQRNSAFNTDSRQIGNELMKVYDIHVASGFW